jgi:hypothetical protein
MRDYTAIYARMIDLTWYQNSPSLRDRWHAMQAAFIAWVQTHPGTVVNRPFSGGHNSTKPLHGALLADFGFRVPASVTSADPAVLHNFLDNHEAINKAISGTRGDAALVDVGDLDGFRRTQGPVHLQQYIQGTDIRIHVIGETVIATHITGDGVDYRAPGQRPTYMPNWELPPSLVCSLIKATRLQHLLFGGWDFKLDKDGTYWCLESNPQPGYNSYDLREGGAISRALIELLVGHQGDTES